MELLLSIFMIFVHVNYFNARGTANQIDMIQKILLWDNDGTITGSKNPDDTVDRIKGIFPGVKNTMKNAKLNFVISGRRTPESELKNWDVNHVTDMFMALMDELPIQAVAFSPMIGGVSCYVIIKKSDGKISVKKAHEEPRYKKYMGHFKKPGIGMFVVMQDVAQEEFGQSINARNSLMIGDTWHDKEMAEEAGIPFVDATYIHQTML